MKVISTELQSTITADSEHTLWPATNLLTDYIGEKWQAISGTTSATLTVSFSAGGSNTLAIFGTNAQTVSWVHKNLSGATVESGSEDLTSPNAVNRCWIEFSPIEPAAQEGTLEITLTHASDDIYAGVVVAGIRTEWPDPDFGMKEGRKSSSIVKDLSNGAKYIKVRNNWRYFSGKILMTRETDARSWLKFWDDNGEDPFAWLIVEDVDDNICCCFGSQLEPPDMSWDMPADAPVTFYIEEAV